jgi:hypothetical protein
MILLIDFAYGAYLNFYFILAQHLQSTHAAPAPTPAPAAPAAHAANGAPTHVHEAANSYSLVPATPRAAIAMIRT